MLGVFFRQSTALLFLQVLLILIYACRNSPNTVEETELDFQIATEVLSIYSGGSIQMKATIINQDDVKEEVTSVVIWQVSPGIAGTITENGIFSSVNNITGVETITAEYRAMTASIQIEVTPRADIIGLWPAMVNLQAGDELQFRCAAAFQNGQEAWVTDEVSWSIEPGLAASIGQNGLLQTQPRATGVEKVMVSYHGWTAESEVEIQQVYQSRFEMMRIPAGEFLMGDDNGDGDEAPRHRVFTDAFEIGKFEVTNSEYATFLTEGLKRNVVLHDGNLILQNMPPYRFVFYTKIPDYDRVEQFFRVVSGDGLDEVRVEVTPGFENHPVVYVTWYGAYAFAEFYGFRLPFEAEWEKAARGGQQLEYATADGSMSNDLANIAGFGGRDIYERTAAVGSFPPNPYGVHDMSGNVAEFIRDFYETDFYGNSPYENPSGPHDIWDILARRARADWLLRSGSWSTSANRARCATRYHLIEPHDNVVTTPTDGFRVARSFPN